ncbi:MAG: ABC transporter ATP-binding protein [Saccharolobus sp.]|jgi:ABC-2 type transport system ATP-binding protein|uniref:ABC transporter ATP-binding protein n=1 Tax=Saccharolobus sp. TaxID=2100761 RepID=UPI0028CE367E|nr:ABC transporter ATP-binding protein [Saccharolobus sp.]MDT7861366.1 ABC transporter ATP-binding protein [Saccharolobus sp.]
MLLTVRNLVVKYGSFVAVNSLNFSVDKEVYCLLGPNGAGKSSTLKAIMNMVPFEGHIEILGIDNKEKIVKNYIGYVPEQPALYEYMTPAEIISFVASLRGIRDLNRISALIRAFSLEQYMNTPIASLSMGNKQKVSILLSLIHEPKLLILDEPFNALDILSVKVLKELIQTHVKNGGGVLFSTHIMEVAEKICNRIGIMNRGVMVMETTAEGIREAGKSLEDIFLSVTGLDEEVKDILKGLE